jgi:hypothetical protein
VTRDESALRELGAYDHDGDPFVWVDQYTRDNHETPDRLVMPDGDPRTWDMHVYRSDNGDWVGVEVEMWTEQEGQSDLTFELDIQLTEDGRLRPEFGGIHVP